jgi:hypothetical protein
MLANMMGSLNQFVLVKVAKVAMAIGGRLMTTMCEIATAK